MNIIDKIITETINNFLLVESQSAESCEYQGEYYSWLNQKAVAVPFMFFNSILRCGNANEIDTHELIALLYAYDILRKEPPLNKEYNTFEYNTMYHEIQTGIHQRLWENLIEEITIRGRYFIMPDDTIIFTTYENLHADQAKKMMMRVAMKQNLDLEKCFYQTGYSPNIVNIPLIKQNKEW